MLQIILKRIIISASAAILGLPLMVFVVLNGSPACAAMVDPYFIMNSSLDRLSQPIPMGEFMFPDEYERALKAYNSGNYRLCILELEDLINLGLPDGRLDTYLFMAGECYHQLKLDKFATKLLRQLLEQYPGSPYSGYASYRLQEDAYTRGDEPAEQYYFKFLKINFKDTEVGYASLFMEGKRYYKANQCAEADKLLSGIPKKSEVFAPASFIRSLCALENNNYEKAVLELEAVLKTAGTKPLQDEAALVLVEIYRNLKKDELASKLLKNISESSAKYGDALLFQSQFYLGKGEVERAVRMGEELLFFNNGAYMFEAAMVLENAYMKQGKREKVDSLRNYLEITVRKRKMIFQLYRELDILTDMQVNFNYFCEKETEKFVNLENRRKVSLIFDEYTAKINKLKEKDASLLFSIDRTAYVIGSSGIYEVRYIEDLDKQIKVLMDNADSLSSELTLYTAKVEGKNPETEKALLKKREDIQSRIRNLNELKSDIKTFCLSENPYLTGTEDVEAKFVDWNIMHLEEMKNRLREVYREISKIDKSKIAGISPDDSPAGTAGEKVEKPKAKATIVPEPVVPDSIKGPASPGKTENSKKPEK